MTEKHRVTARPILVGPLFPRPVVDRDEVFLRCACLWRATVPAAEADAAVRAHRGADDG